MENLTDVYQQIAAADAGKLEKQAAVIKVAEEEDAAGRIMARGFADELTKIAGDDAGYGQDPSMAKTKLPTPPKVGGTVKAPDFKVGGGATGPGPGLAGRPIKAPPVKAEPEKVKLKRPGGRQ